MARSTLENALRDSIQDVKDGYRYNGVKMLADVQAGRSVQPLSKRERKVWRQLYQLVHRS